MAYSTLDRRDYPVGPTATETALAAAYPATYKLPVLATGATSAGAWTPAGSVPPPTLAALQSARPNAVTASPATAWTAGQSVQTGQPGNAGKAAWNGSAWVAYP